MCLVRSMLAHTSLLMSGGAIPANKYKSFTYVDLRHPVITRHTLSSYGSNMSAYVDFAHIDIGAAYSAIDLHRASAVVLIVFAFVPYFELDIFFKRLLRVASFILLLCM